MKLYIHKWFDKETGRVCKTGDGHIATSIPEAIEDHDQENFAYDYDCTLVLDTETKTFIEIDIRVEIEAKKRREMAIGEFADYMGITRQQAERLEARTY